MKRRRRTLRRLTVRALLTIAMVATVAPAADESADQPKLVIAIAERHYETEKSLPPFARERLADDFSLTFITAPPENGRNNLAGIERALQGADLLLLSVRRRTPKASQMRAIREYVESGGPVVGLRTASHAFSIHGDKPPEGHASWERFDPQVIGGSYDGHWGESPIAVRRHPEAPERHPILRGVRLPFESPCKLYRTAPLADGATPLLVGNDGEHEPQPVAWTHQHLGGGRVFYVALGEPGDFENPAFRRLLARGVRWAAGMRPTRDGGR